MGCVEGDRPGIVLRHVSERTAAPGHPRHRDTGIGGNVPPERAELVVILRVYREYPLRTVHPQAVDQSPCRIGACRRVRPCSICHTGPVRRYMRRIFTYRHGVYGRLPAVVVFLLRGPAPYPCIQTCPGKGRFLDMQPGYRRTPVRTAHRRGRTPLDERGVRYRMLRRMLPAVGLPRGFGKNHRQIHDADMQIFRGYFLPPLYGALPFYLSVLWLGEERGPHVPGIPAGCCRGRRRKYYPGLYLSETV